jgi:hypothetical protein
MTFLLDKRKTLLEMECSLKRNLLTFVPGLNVKFLGSLAQKTGVSSFLSFQKGASIYECKLVTTVPGMHNKRAFSASTVI